METVTENEARLCSRLKELQLKVDELEFDQNRSRLVLNHSGLENLKHQTPAAGSGSVTMTTVKKKHRKSANRSEKRDRKEKEEIKRVFGGVKSSKTNRAMASTPRSEKSDITIKFTDNQHCDGDEAGQLELSRIQTDLYSRQLVSEIT